MKGNVAWGKMAAKLDDALKQCQKILNLIQTHKDAGPFLEPVKWNEWGLTDYPKVIKHPMDLGRVNVCFVTIIPEEW